MAPARAGRRGLFCASPGAWQGGRMGLFDRVSRVASANFNALLSKLEDPKKEVDQTIREMEGEVRRGRQEIVEATAAEDLARKKVAELAAAAEKWAARAELAVRHG